MINLLYEAIGGDIIGSVKELNITKDDIVYISGPMTGIPDANRNTFNKAEKLNFVMIGKDRRYSRESIEKLMKA